MNPTGRIPLATLAHGRSGDKGNHANVAVLAYTPAGYDWLVRHLTADAVRQYFQPLGPSRVERFEVPNVRGLNFVLYDVWHKGNPLGPLVMAGCRLLVYVSAFVAFAWPPASHIVWSPYRILLLRMWWMRVVINRAPLAPSGWPSAIAPPSGLSRRSSAPVSASHAMGTGANASLTSKAPMSRI